MQIQRKKFKLSALLGVSAALLAFSQPSMADDLSLRLNWKMKGEFTPFVVGSDKGMFSRNGTTVSVEEGSGATLALQSVATGEDDFAYVPSVQLIQAVNNGMPVKAIATVSKVDSMGMVARPGISLQSPKDLEGKTVEIASASTFNNIWEAFAATNDIDVSKVEVVSVNPGARFNLLLSGQVDILADIFLTNELPVLKSKAGEDLNSIAVGDYGFRIIGYTLVTSTDMIENQPEQVSAFLAGAKEAFQFTLDNPDEAISIATSAYPDVLQPEATKGQVEALVGFLNMGEPSTLFEGSIEGWQATLDALESAGVIDTKKEASAYFTNEFLDK
ncbi:ABC transporter substrate-binding protein [Labrenzia sp. 011]|uniref:ABC transporter substrate-binding protein n=1 Tax=Labrenzia sp. 011 TaxID=2171494 RepID=UPI000D5135CB|nr:ABC transporter substrate-binding protein [Labrenzia sp. 011]PVB63179.1 hypothetical protein DCO57_04800 [Labrenzia sp. 011]